MWPDLKARIRLGLQELHLIEGRLSRLAEKAPCYNDETETMAAAAILHSFYTEIEKILKMIALDVDGGLPESNTWHKDLLEQMITGNAARDQVISSGLQSRIKPYLAFRHMFRGASIVLMRWDKLHPLASDAKGVLADFEAEMENFLRRHSKEAQS